MTTSNEKMAALVKKRPSHAESLYRTFHNMNVFYRNKNQGLKYLPSWFNALKPGSKILDVGCGNGLLCNWLEDRGFEVTGLDIVPGPYNRDKYEFVLHDLQKGKLPFENNAFDCVLCFDVFEHIHLRWAEELIYDMMRVGGNIVAGVACFGSTHEDLHITVRPVEWWTEKFARIAAKYSKKYFEVFTSFTKNKNALREQLLFVGSEARHGED